MWIPLHPKSLAKNTARFGVLNVPSTSARARNRRGDWQRLEFQSMYENDRKRVCNANNWECKSKLWLPEAVWHDMFYHGKDTQEIMLRVLEFVGHISIPSIPCFNELNITWGVPRSPGVLARCPEHCREQAKGAKILWISVFRSDTHGDQCVFHFGTNRRPFWWLKSQSASGPHWWISPWLWGHGVQSFGCK